MQDALEPAIRSITRDASVVVQAVLESDTAGVAGSSAIADTVFEEIT